MIHTFENISYEPFFPGAARRIVILWHKFVAGDYVRCDCEAVGGWKKYFKYFCMSLWFIFLLSRSFHVEQKSTSVISRQFICRMPSVNDATVQVKSCRFHAENLDPLRDAIKAQRSATFSPKMFSKLFFICFAFFIILNIPQATLCGDRSTTLKVSFVVYLYHKLYEILFMIRRGRFPKVGKRETNMRRVIKIHKISWDSCEI